jgi:hypothetical protein
MSNDNTPPVQWHSVISRRGLLAAGTGVVVGGGLLSGCAHAPKMSGNVPKEQARYQDHPNGLEHCSICKHYGSNGLCEVVAGPVSPDGWCRFYALL